ncbi:MAG: tagA [Dactylosporangium sp.]|jgi:N-acetylglucosaminyldiphosphoundecaprenol N-acetyl-beta-D-mannosaminyltransferase|nr:tagA [Dactylosporangium sp.]
MRVSGTPARIVLGGASVDLWRDDDVYAAVRDRLVSHDGPPLAVSSANIDHIHHFGPHGASRSDLDFTDTSPRWVVLLDGAPLVRKAHRLTGVEWPRLAGSDLLGPLLTDAEAVGARVGFLGGTVAMQERLTAVLAHSHPGLKMAGMWAPERAELADPEGARALAHAARMAGVDLLVVGLGKPRQERWIQHHAAESGARVLLAFGASADFLAGSVSRAPEWMQRASAEWLYRLAKEPRRLARRYCLQGPPAMWRLWTDSRLVSDDETTL